MALYSGLGGAGDTRGGVGIAAPQTLGSVVAPQVAAPPQAAANTASWYDPSKAWDHNNPLSALNSQTGYKFYDATNQMLKNTGGDYESTPVDAYAVSPTGQRLKAVSGSSIGQDPNGKYFVDTFGNPTSQSNHDLTDVTYKMDANGNAVPIGANDYYKQSSWMASGPDVLKTLGTVLAAGAAGGAFTGAEAGGVGGSAEGLSGMDLAADAGATSGNNIAYAGGQLGGGGAASAGGEIANTGSDAHFYQPQEGGVGVQDLGNMGAAGTPTIPSMSLGSGSSLADLLKQGGKALIGSQQGTGSATGSGGSGGLLALLGGGSSMSAGDRYRQQLLSQSLRDGQQQQPQAMPGWIPGG